MAKVKQLSIDEKKPLTLNLIQGQYWGVIRKLREGVISNNNTNKYQELREITTEDGIVQKLVEVDYPITADYVKSFAGSVDYKTDLAGNLNQPRVNLGDMERIQQVQSMDMASVRALVEKLNSALNANQTAQTVPVNTDKEIVEVDNNGK